MFTPRWLSNLFGSTPEETPTDTSVNLTKRAHQSELVQNILKDQPSVEVQAEAPSLCIECEKPLPSGQKGLCDRCAKEETTVEASKVSLVAELEKRAGPYELGDSELTTANKSREDQVKSMSDFALAECLTEIHLQGTGIQEQWFREFPKVLKQVQKNRKSLEKELLKGTPPPAVLDRMTFLAECMENSHNSEFEPTEAKDLYGPLFELEGKQSWEKSKYRWKDEPLTEKEQYAAQMPQETGPGREAEDTRGHQAPRSAIAGIHDLDDIQMVPQDRYLVHYCKVEGGERYFKWFHTEDAAQTYLDSLKHTEYASSSKLKDCSKQFTSKSQETVQKDAAQILNTTPTGWYVTVKLEANDNPEQLVTAIRATTGVSRVSRYYDHLQVRLDGVGLDEKGASSIVQSALETQHSTPAGESAMDQVAASLGSLSSRVVRVAKAPLVKKAQEENKFFDAVGDVAYALASGQVIPTIDQLMQNHTLSSEDAERALDEGKRDAAENLQHGSEAAILPKVEKTADIASPWAVVRKDDQDVIARITPEEVSKKSKEKDGKDVKKSAAQVDDIVLLVQKWLDKTAAPKEPADLEPAMSLEGLTPEEQELWKKHWKLAFSWAMADPLSRKLGKSLTRQVAMQALLRVIRKYDPTHESGAKLESYLFRAIHNELLTGFVQNRTVKEKKPELFVNIDQPVSEGDRMYEAETLQDIIEDANEATPEEHLSRAQDADIALEVVRRAKEVLKGNALQVFELMAQGYTVSNVAELMKWTIPNAVRYRIQIGEVLKKIMEQVKQHPPKPSLRKEIEAPELSTDVPNDLADDQVMTNPEANV